MDEPVIVIGAGIGGLSASIRLAAAGKKVILLEANSQVGGKMGEIRQDGFRWDTGPSVITMRHVFEDLFQAAGRRMEDYLDLQPVVPLTRYFYPGGRVLDIFSDLPGTLEQVRLFASEQEARGYARFLAYAAEIHRITGPVFIYDLPPTWKSFLKVSPLDIPRVDGLRTMDQAARGFVRSPELRQLLGRFATYVGASPYLAPATLNVIAHVELNQGVWYPAGGVYAIARAMQNLAQELGVEIRLESRVRRIEVKDGRAVGVVLQDDTFQQASAVISNLDVSATYEKLLPPLPQVNRRFKQLQAVEPSCSGFILLLGVQKQYPALAHHNIFFSSDYQREFDEIFSKGIPPAEPTIYVAITSKSTPEDAPAGCENWFVLVNAPALSPQWDWNVQKETYRDQVLALLARHGCEVRDHLVTERILTPVEIEQMTGARRGALYGASSNNRWAAFRRPHNRCREIRGLYFAGGTTHPGGGVPMVTLSGKVASRLYLEDQK